MTTPQGERNSLAAAAVANVCVLGATGMLGRALCASLEQAGVKVTRYSRAERPGFAHWNPDRNELDRAPLERADAVVNLAGEGIADKRWTKARKRVLRESRVHSTALLARTLAELSDPPSVLVNASAVGFYGDRGEEAVYEDSPAGTGFLAELCEQWEQATAPAARAGIRVAIPRIGVVLTPEGGALAKLLPVFRLGLGGNIGSGEQHMPWIALPDAVSVLRFLIVSRDLSGPVNAVAPEATTNEHFTDALARATHRPAFMPVPSLALRAVLGELSEALLEGANVRPRVLEQAGFRFELPRLEDALDALLPAV
ncbi:MAG TPA: TIGR01777 family oxidoreductase [Polyangiales bacterium]